MTNVYVRTKQFFVSMNFFLRCLVLALHLVQEGLTCLIVLANHIHHTHTSTMSSEAAVSYASLILADAEIEITSDKLLALTKAAGVEVDSVST